MKNLLPLFCLIPYFTIAQTAELGELRWGKSNKKVVKLHIDEVIELSGKSVEQIHQLSELWYESSFVDKNLAYQYRWYGPTGDNQWVKERKKLYQVNESDRIWTQYILCEDCFTIRKKSRSKSDGYFRVMISIRENRVNFVVADFRSVSEDSFVSDWIIKRNKLVERPDSRLSDLETHFTELKASYFNFLSTIDLSKDKEDGAVEKDLDEW
jgi:hypothetical protein